MMPPHIDTEEVDKNDMSESLGVPFFAPAMTHQTFPTVPPSTAIHSVRMRQMETEHKMDRGWDPCHSTECLHPQTLTRGLRTLGHYVGSEKLMLLHKSGDFQLQSPIPTAVCVSCMNSNETPYLQNLNIVGP